MKETFIDFNESVSSVSLGPQSPCERTDLRMAIVADHLGLSWTGNNHNALLFSRSLVLFISQALFFTATFRLSRRFCHILLHILYNVALKRKAKKASNLL